MPTRTISTKLVLEGENEYKAGLKNTNAEIRLHKSELEKVSVQYQDCANSLEALQAKQTALKGVLDNLNKKHELQSTMLERAKQAQQTYTNRAAQLRAELEKLETAIGANSEQGKKLAEDLATVEKKMQQASNTVTDYQKQLNNTERDQASFGAELRQCTASIEECGKSVKASNDALGALASTLAAAGVAKGIQEITGALQDCTGASIKFESAVTGVYKTVEGTPEQLAEISAGIKKMTTDIPATTTEISAVAEAAGQLGIATDNVMDFTRVMIDLGESTNLTAESAASDLAKIANITGMAADNYDRMGSVVVALGNNLATTEADIVSMSTRLASAGKMAGLTEAEIMALSAAMSSVGIEAEAGGTAMTQTMSAIEKAVAGGGDSLSKFARIAGMSSAEFAAKWKNDAIGAIQSFIAGLGKLDAQGESAVLVLDELGLSGVRQSNMLKSLALAADTMTGAVALANQAWEENTALAEEAGKRYETTESKLAMMNNALDNVKVAIGDALNPALNEMTESGTDAFVWAADFIEKNPWLVQAITGVTGGIALLSGGLTAYTAVSKLAKTVQDELNLSMSLCPAMMVAAAIGVLVVAVASYAASVDDAETAAQKLNTRMEESRKTYEDTAAAIQSQGNSALAMVDALNELMQAEEKTAAQKDAILNLVDQLNEAVPGLSLAYDEQTEKLNLTTEALERLAMAQAKQAELEAKQEYLKDLYPQRAQATQDLETAQEALTQAEEEYARVEAELTEITKTRGYLSVEEAAARTDARQAVRELQAAVDDLNTVMAQQNEEIAKVEAECNDLTATIFGTTEEIKENTAALDSNRAAQLSLADALEMVSGGYEVLVKAQEESASSGNLSLSTLQSLLRKYPELERYLVETADGYALADGALEDYIDTQRVQYQVIYDSAASAAQEAIHAEALKAEGYDTTTMSIKNQLEAMKALYAAQAAEARSKSLEEDGNGRASRIKSLDNSEFRQAISGMTSVQQALDDLEAAEKNLNTYNRAAATATRSYKGGTSGSGRAANSTSNGAAAVKTAGQTLMDELEEWLEDMDHQIFLWSKDDSKTEAIVELYRQMQDKAHEAAEQLRAAGYSETSDEIQQLQKLWWEYADELTDLKQDMYDRDIAALETAYDQGQMTAQEYLDTLLILQNKYFATDSTEWADAEQKRQQLIEKFAKAERQAREDAYSDALADAKYFRDMDLISEQEYYAEMARLRDEYLEEDSAAWKAATVELHNYQKERLESTLEEIEDTYQNQLKALSDALSAQLKELDAQLKEAQEKEKEAYQAAKDAAKEAFEEKKAAIQAELALEQNRLNAILDGINREIQARKELREDEDQDSAIAAAKKRLEAAQAQLAYARTDEDKSQWEKEVIRLQEALDKAIQTKEDTAFYREKELEKQQVNEDLSAAKDTASQKQEEAKSEYNENLKSLEADYNAAIAKLETEFADKKEQAEKDYQKAVAEAKQNYQTATSQAQESANQKQSAAGGGSVSKQAAERQAADAEMAEALKQAGFLAAAVSTAATAAQQIQNNVVNKNNSANLTINQVSNWTEGQAVRTMQKLLDKLDR